MNIYHYQASSTLEIADGSRTTTIVLPKGANPVEVAYLIHSDTLKEIITQLTGGNRDEPCKKYKLLA